MVLPMKVYNLEKIISLLSKIMFGRRQVEVEVLKKLATLNVLVCEWKQANELLDCLCRLSLALALVVGLVHEASRLD